MKSLKHSYFLILCTLITLSCKKEKQAHLTKEQVILPEQEVANPDEKDLYLPIKIEGSGLSLTLKYQDNTALLTEILDANKNKTTITYTAEQQPQKLEKYIDKELHITFYQQEDKINTTKTLNYLEKSKVRVLTGSRTLSYNEQKKINTINYYNEKNVLLKTNNLKYTASLNLLSLSTLSPESSSTYTYDQKKGISSNIPHIELFSLAIEHSFLWCSVNNVLTILNQKHPENNLEANYEYNKNGYPSSMTINSKQGKQTFKITYKKLEQ